MCGFRKPSFLNLYFSVAHDRFSCVIYDIICPFHLDLDLFLFFLFFFSPLFRVARVRTSCLTPSTVVCQLIPIVKDPLCYGCVVASLKGSLQDQSDRFWTCRHRVRQSDVSPRQRLDTHPLWCLWRRWFVSLRGALICRLCPLFQDCRC